MRSVVVLILAALVLPACSGVQVVSRLQLAAPAPEPERPRWEQLVAESLHPRILVWRRPHPAAHRRPVPRARLDTGPQVFLVLEQRDGWVRVQLPVRPNASTGWLRERDVRLVTVDHAIHIDRRRRVLVASRRGRTYLRARVVIGAPGSPTPPGRWYVTYGVRLAEPDGAYGPFAVGLSAHSPTLDTFNGQDAQIALHGTNRPELRGQAVSNGCVRMANRDVLRLIAQLPRGTPVTIV